MASRPCFIRKSKHRSCPHLPSTGKTGDGGHRCRGRGGGLRPTKTPRLVPEPKYTKPLRAENTGAKPTKTGKKDGKRQNKEEGATQNHQNEARRQATAKRGGLLQAGPATTGQTERKTTYTDRPTAREDRESKEGGGINEATASKGGGWCKHPVVSCKQDRCREPSPKQGGAPCPTKACPGPRHPASCFSLTPLV